MRMFGPAEFQLMLLRRMADYQPGLVQDAVRSLGEPRRAVTDAHRRWQMMIRSRSFPGGSDRYRLILGAPRGSFLRRVGDLTTEVSRWTLPLWPDLRFEIMTIPGGPVLQEWLIRPDPVTRPRLETAADARPWTCVVSDFSGCAAAEHHDDTPSRWAVTFTAPGDQGEPRRHLARFTWGLLQTVTPL